MRLKKEIGQTEYNKLCQLCTLSIYDGDIFNCIECDYTLHKVCTYFPLNKQFVMHPHPLVLRKSNAPHALASCFACYRQSNCVYVHVSNGQL